MLASDIGQYLAKVMSCENCFTMETVVRCKTFIMKKFMLRCSFNFEVYTKNIKKKAAKCSLKSNEVLLNADGYVLT